jgi:hypothetical protein
MSSSPAPQPNAEIDDLLEKVKAYKQRFAGKSIPLEKFVLRKARKYFMQDRWLFLPAFELLFVWSGISSLKQKQQSVMRVLDAAIGRPEERERERERIGFFF